MQPLNVLLEMDGGAGVWRMTSLSDTHLAKAEPPIFFRAVERSTEVSMVHSRKASLPIEVTPTGSLMLFSDEHFSKASSPMVVRDTGRSLLKGLRANFLNRIRQGDVAEGTATVECLTVYL